MVIILTFKTLKLRTRFHIVKVVMNKADPYNNDDFDFVERMVVNNSVYSGFRYITGQLRQSDNTYSTYWLCSLKPRRSISDKELQMFKDIIEFSSL